MKNFLLLLLVFMTWESSNANAQCPSLAGLNFSTQAEIDNFKAYYPGCTDFPGYVEVSQSIWGGNYITNLNGLSNLKSVGGGFIINGTSVTTLSDLSSLESIAKYLLISNNSYLQNLNGLSSLTTIGEELTIRYNNTLTNLDGLSSLTSIGRDLIIQNNNSLTNLDGLSSVTGINGGLNISYNPKLGNISGISNIGAETINSLFIASNPLLSVCYLPNLCIALTRQITRYINDNAGDCFNTPIAMTACTTCHAPTNVVTKSVTGLSATFSWAEAYLSANYEWKVVESGADPNTATSVASGSVTGTLATATGLTEGNEYDFYVKNNCGSSGNSNWSTKASFTSIKCPVGNINFSTQKEIDNFIVYYPTCTNIENTITVEGTDIINLAGLGNIKNIGESLYITNSNSLTNLSGLENLESIGGELNISENNNLTNLNGLTSLKSVLGDFKVQGNYVLSSLPSLSYLKKIGGGLQISFIGSLTDLGGFTSLDSIGGDFTIWALSTSNISGFTALKSVGESLTITQTGLTNLNGFSALTSVGDRVDISQNSELTNISGLSGILPMTFKKLTIKWNPLLAVCNQPNFCTFLSIPENSIDVSSNAVGCNNVQEILAACNPCSAVVTLTSPINDYSSGMETKKAKAINGKINASNKISHTAKINYEAASIELLSGFQAEAKNGAVFSAVVGGCN